MGVGNGKGDNRAKDAVQAAIESPLLETHISGAKAILLYVAGGYDLGMMEVSEIADIVEKEASDDAILIFGASVEESMNDEVSITVIATGFDEGLGVEDDIIPANDSSDGLHTKEVTLDEIFNSDTGSSDDGSFKIPGFLNK
jgi:cell division protein FtsZ